MAGDYDSVAAILADGLLERATRRIRQAEGASAALKEGSRAALVAFQATLSGEVASGEPLSITDLASMFGDQDVLNELSELLRARRPQWEDVADALQHLQNPTTDMATSTLAMCLQAFEAAFVGALSQSPVFADEGDLPDIDDGATPSLSPSAVHDLVALLRETPLQPGAINAGRISAHNVVSGQQIIINVNQQASADTAQLNSKRVDVLRPYLEQVLLTCSTPGFGDPTRSTVDAPGLGSMALDRLWTALRVVDIADGPAGDDVKDHRTAPLPDADDDRPIADVLGTPGTYLVLGGPGSGKSTAVAYLASQYARTCLRGERQAGLASPVPIRVLLRDIVTGTDEPTTNDIWSGVAELGILRRDAERDAKAIEDGLRDCLVDGQATLFLDGLDEVREDLLPATRALIALLSETWSRAQILITCRTYDYMTPVPNRRVVATRTVRLLPYRSQDAGDYVTKWYAEAARVGRFTTEVAERQREGLLGSLQEYAALRELAATPLLLALLTVVHSEEGSLPDSRAVVSYRAVRYMLAESAYWQGKGGETVATPEMMDLAEHVAFVAQSRLEKLGREFRGLTRSELQVIVSDYFRLDEQPQLGGQFQEVFEKVIRHLNGLIRSNGLLVDQGQGVYAFAHRSFQEFLAGQYFAPGGHPEEALRSAQDPNWRESFRLLAGYGSREGNSFYYLMALIGDLQQQERGDGLPPFKPADVILAGEMLLEIGRATLESKGYERVLRESALGAGPDGLWPRVAHRIVEVIDCVPPVLPAAERVRGAYALAGLRDPRLTTSTGELTSLADRMVQLPAGRFSVGSAAGAGETDEQPRRTFEFPSLAMTRYLITNTEFRSFVEDGGYQVEQWWEAGEARLWMSGDAEFLRDLERTWIGTVRTYHEKELRDGEIREEQLANDAKLRCAPRGEPFYWQNPRFNRTNQPVVGVNWWEARAYAAWLTAAGHGAGWLDPQHILRLPTEFEWERGCRDSDDGRAYPWGEDWDDDRAHTRNDGLELLEPAPIGCYPHGTWPGGPMDLCGNVWEWLEDRKLPYDAEFDPSRYDTTSLEERAIRGSSWYNTSALARSSARFVDRPFNLYFDVGFRLVRVDRDAVGVPKESSS